ncbi:MAG: MMPL family transporter, partial [Methanothrix sp.]|nr:MMPL family transporter [Methanothrix sp.]
MISLERLGVWITRNPTAILAVAAILTLVSFHFAQSIVSQGMNTESMVGKESSLYQIYDHLYKENFGTESIAVLIESDHVTGTKALEAQLRFSNLVKDIPRVVSVSSIADTVADAEAKDSGVRRIPSQEKVDEILANAGPLVMGILPDESHTMMSIVDPVYINDDQRAELLREVREAVNLAAFPPDCSITVTGTPALMKSITDEMNASQGNIMLLAAVLMVVALLLVFRHVKWPLLPIPIVFLGIIWTFGAMGLFHIPMTMVSF